MASSKLDRILATGFGLGYAPKAPGTVGTVGALLISLLIIQFIGDPLANYLHIILSVLSYIIGRIVINNIGMEWGHDPPRVVIDEYCGLWVALIFTPPELYYYILAFVLFRFFDITKILGISYFDRKKTTDGIMLDDVLAGIYTGIICYATYYFFPSLLSVTG